MFKIFREISRQCDTKGKLTDEEIEKVLKSEIYGVFTSVTEDGYPMAVPVHYVYYEGAIYIHTANAGEKYDNIQRYDKVSFLVYSKRDKTGQSQFGMYDSVLAYGKAEIMDPSSSEKARNALKALSIACGMPGKAVDSYLDKYIGKYAAVKINIEHLAGRFIFVK